MHHLQTPAAISTPAPIVKSPYQVSGTVNISLSAIDGGVRLICTQGVEHITGHWTPGEKGKTGFMTIKVFCVGENSAHQVIVQ